MMSSSSFLVRSSSSMSRLCERSRMRNKKSLTSSEPPVSVVIGIVRWVTSDAFWQQVLFYMYSIVQVPKTLERLCFVLIFAVKTVQGELEWQSQQQRSEGETSCTGKDSQNSNANLYNCTNCNTESYRRLYKSWSAGLFVVTRSCLLNFLRSLLPVTAPRQKQPISSKQILGVAGVASL